LGSVEFEVEIAMEAFNGGRVVFHGAEFKDMFRPSATKATMEVRGKITFGSTGGRRWLVLVISCDGWSR
jgi:hypothetical protein